MSTTIQDILKQEEEKIEFKNWINFHKKDKLTTWIVGIALVLGISVMDIIVPIYLIKNKFESTKANQVQKIAEYVKKYSNNANSIINYQTQKQR